MARPQAPVGATKPEPPSSDYRRRLEALRDDLTDALLEAGAREKAALAGQLRAVLADLAALPVAAEGDEVDDLAAKRAARRAGSTAS